MATSSAESRPAPLAEADLARSAFGLFARPPPGLEEMLEEEFARDAVPRLGRSWSGHAARRVARGRRADGEVGSCAISKKYAQRGDDGESQCSTRGTPSPQTASWASRASVSEEGHEYELAQLDLPREPAPSRRISASGLFAHTPAGSAAAPPTAEVRAVTGARTEAATRPEPPKHAPRISTTLMVQNLNRSITRRGFMLSLDEQGFAGKYDFVHIPKPLGTRRNKGFAFVNFAMLEDAEEFARSIARVKGSRMRAVPADVQGLDANVSNASSRKVTRIHNSASRPWVVSGHGQGALLHA